MRSKPWAALLLGMLAALPAFAAGQRPSVLPLRDVTVEYRVTGRSFQDIRSVAARYSVAAQRLRLDTDDRAMGYLLVDPRSRMARMVVPGINQYVELTLAKDRRAALLFNDKLAFTRRGNATIAGLACTVWDVRGGKDTARACITDDGVILRAEGTGGDAAGNTLEATRVNYTPQMASMFQLPSGSGQLNVQSLLRGLARPQ